MAESRGFIAHPPPYQRWEALLRAERSTGHQLVLLAARSRILRRLLNLPKELAEPVGTSVADREQRVRLARIARPPKLTSPLGRLFRKRPRLDPPVPIPQTGLPVPGPLVQGEIDAALSFLRNMPFEEVQRHGSQLHPNHFSSPSNDLRFLRENPQMWLRERVPDEIDWGLDAQEELVGQLRPYVEELSDVPVSPHESPGQFVWRGGPFSGFDACAYYGLVRHLRPRRVIEVGIGWSTLVLRRAVDVNGETAEVTLIDPHPDQSLLGDLRPGWRIVEGMLQHVDLTEFDDLSAGDIVFYDGSHCARTGSDVNWMLFEVMPRLADGVWVHFHDIFWPGDYPAPWLLDEGLSWNEQYLLQAFLMYNDAWRVRLAVTLLRYGRRETLAAMSDQPWWPYAGASVWLEKVSQ